MVLGIAYITAAATFDKGLAVISFGVGVVAVGLGFTADDVLKEIRRSEVDEKLAMLNGHIGNVVDRIIFDLESLERNVDSATDTQKAKIARASGAFLAWMQEYHSEREREAKTILNRILKSIGKPSLP
jgi:hypothetical protein